MERLTKYCEETSHENGICCTHFGGPECCEVGGNCALNCKWEEAAWERLAHYEDTRLTPAEVHSMYGEWNAMMSVLNSIGGYDRLCELAEADRDGRVVILPVKAGNEVYCLYDECDFPGDCHTKQKCKGCSYRKLFYETQILRLSMVDEYGNLKPPYFITEEEAKQAIKEELNREN
mgnify:CR=1 FL=1